MNSVDISEPQDFKHIFHYPNSGMDDSSEDTKKYVKVGLFPRPLFHFVTVKSIDFEHKVYLGERG